VLLEKVWNVDAIELRLEMFEQKREVENYRVVSSASAGSGPPLRLSMNGETALTTSA
jgi:hypothetical protein